MKKLHIVIPDLILPRQLADYACSGLRLPALEKLLARAKSGPLQADTLEDWLCRQFGVEGMPVAPLTLQADGVQAGDSYWLRADPVGFQMQQTRMVLQADLGLGEEEAGQLCAALNVHFAGDGFQFVAPHPQRWYLRLTEAPAMHTTPLPQAVGADMHAHLPRGADALRWHVVINEIQMLLHGHQVNQLREQRGEPAVSGVWLWGGGFAPQGMSAPFAALYTDSDLAAAFARAAGMPRLQDVAQLLAPAQQGSLLVVWEGLRRAIQQADIAGWRDSVQQLEEKLIRPAWAALMAGEVDQITLDVVLESHSRRFVAGRSAKWKWWCFAKSLPDYANS